MNLFTLESDDGILFMYLAYDDAVIDVNGLSAVTLWPICEKLFMMITALQRLRVKLVHIYGQSPTALPIIHSWVKESQNFGRLCRV
jgi:hypothetical protein